MAQKKEQYEGALDSIFSFIFAEAKRNVKSAPPKTIPGIKGDEMAYALGEIALRPGIYAGEEVLTPLNEALGAISVTGTETKLDKSNKVKTGISLKNAGDFFADPEGFIDASFKGGADGRKAGKKLAFIRGVGGVMDLGIGAIAAKSAGLGSLESLAIGQVLGNQYMDQEGRDDKAEEFAAIASGYDVGRDRNLNFAYTDKLAKTFASVLSSTKVDRKAGLNISSNAFRREVQKKMARFGYTNPAEISDLIIKHEQRENEYISRNIKIEEGEWSLGQMDKGVPRDDRKKINFANPDEWLNSKDPSNRLMAVKRDELKSRLIYLNSQGVPNTDPEKELIRKEIKLLKAWQISNGPNLKFSRYLGEAYLNVNAFNDLVLKGGGLSALLSGDLFNEGKNNLSPSTKQKAIISAFDRTAVLGEIVVPRDDMNRLYRSLNGLYYFTPGSIARTLFVNGEGFVYLAHLKQQRIMDMIKGSSSIYNFVQSNPALFNTLLGGMVIPGNQKAVLEELAKLGKYNDLLNILNTAGGAGLADPRLAAVFSQLEKLSKQLEKSPFLKYAQTIQEVMNQLSIKRRINEGLGNLAIRMFGSRVGSKLKSLFLGGKIALKNLAQQGARKIMHILAQALGFATTGGLANIVLYVATEVIYFVGEKVLKFGVKIGYALVWALGIYLLGGFLSTITWMSSLNPFFDKVSSYFDTASNTAPIFCNKCGPSSMTADGFGGEVQEEAPVDSGGGAPEAMVNVECPLQPGPLNCSQRPYGGFSHGGTNAVDILGPPPSYWYAPSDLEITYSIWSYENKRISGQLCGGIVHAYSAEHDVTYVLIHVVPYVQNGAQISEGSPVAKMAVPSDGNINFIPGEDANGNSTGTCATGAHFHLEIRGTNVYADRYYREFLNCNLSSCP